MGTFVRCADSNLDPLTWGVLTHLSAVARKPIDLTLQIAKRAYELYEQQGRQDGRAVQDWRQAEREIRKDERHQTDANNAAGTAGLRRMNVKESQIRHPESSSLSGW